MDNDPRGGEGEGTGLIAPQAVLAEIHSVSQTGTTKKQETQS